jgi:hypothetical protein
VSLYHQAVKRLLQFGLLLLGLATLLALLVEFFDRWDQPGPPLNDTELGVFGVILVLALILLVTAGVILFTYARNRHQKVRAGDGVAARSGWILDAEKVRACRCEDIGLKREDRGVWNVRQLRRAGQGCQQRAAFGQDADAEPFLEPRGDGSDHLLRVVERNRRRCDVKNDRGRGEIRGLVIYGCGKH